MRAPAALLLLLVPLATPAADFEALVDSVVQAYGGPPAAARTATFRVDARVDATLRRRAGKVRREFRAPDALRVEITYPGETELRLLSGDRGWRGTPDGMGPVTGLPRLAMVYQLLRSAVPWTLTHHRSLLVDRGRERRRGTGYRLVGLPWSPELDLTFWVHSVNRRVVAVEGTLHHGGRQAGFATTYGDFRRIGGVLMPFTEESYANGHHTGTTRLERVVFAPSDLGPFEPGGREPR